MLDDKHGMLLATEGVGLNQMKRFLFATLLMIAVSLSSLDAQAPGQKEDQTIYQLVKEVQAQQTEIAANQTKIETKLAEVAEAVRIARIYSSRGR